MFCGNFITGKARKDFSYAPLEIRYVCEECDE